MCARLVRARTSALYFATGLQVATRADRSPHRRAKPSARRRTTRSSRLSRTTAAILRRTHAQPSRCSCLGPGLVGSHGRSSDWVSRRSAVQWRPTIKLTLVACVAGFSCQANEFSLFMLIASSFILNGTTSINQFSLYPYLHSFSNSRSASDLLAPVPIPDVLPSDVEDSQGDFSFASGDFLQVYAAPSERGTWDAVATCFFIDTARNVVDYLEMIWRLLKPGGVWVNCGPTLWHFENTEGASSIELTLEGVKQLARRIGFVLSVSHPSGLALSTSSLCCKI